MQTDKHALAHRIVRLPQDKRGAFFELLARQRISLAQVPIVPVPTDGTVALSHSQQRLWFLAQLEPQSTAYHMPAAFRLRGRLDLQALQRSFSRIVERHEVLRTAFAARGDAVEAHVRGPGPLPLTRISLLSHSPAQREAVARNLARDEGRRPFDLAQGPLLRVALLEFSDQEHWLLVTLHHIACDAGSMAVLMREFVHGYVAFSQGRQPVLPALPVQYADFAAWQRMWLDADAADPQAEHQLAYWRQTLGAEHPVLELPLDRPRPRTPDGRGARHRLTVAPELTAAWRSLTRDHRATLFMGLLATFQLLLYRLTGQGELRIGVPVTRRHRPEIEGLIGLFVNTLVLRGSPAGHLGFTEWLEQVKQSVLQAQAHADLPFERLVEALQPQRELGHTPLFQVMFNLVTPPATIEPCAGLQLEPLAQEAGAAQFDLSLDVVERVDTLDLVFSFRTELFEPATIARWAMGFEQLMKAVAAAPQARLGELALPHDRDALQVAPLASGRVFDPLPVHARFERQARAAPTAEALVLDGVSLSYAELNQRANRLAHRLIAAGASAEQRIGVCVPRSFEMVIALLAALKAGVAYVPLDPDYPADRLAMMIEDAGIALLLAPPELAARLQGLNADLRCVSVADAAGPSHDPGLPTHPEQLAYVMYTSGSTGRPKGVCISHAALAAHVDVTLEFLRLTARDRVLQFSTFNFDGFVEQLYPALACGACVVLRGPEVWGAEELHERILRERITVTDLTTAYWAQVVQDFAAAAPRAHGAWRLCSVTGEAMPPEGVNAWRRAGLGGVRLLNTYGPTEATVTAMLYDCEPHVQGRLALPARMPIGRALPGRSIQLIDPDANPAPAGVAGELCIGGALLARGYLGRPGLTAERFVPDPFGPPGARRYRSGDRARRRDDGIVDYLGRIDHQVKLRGFRIELGEIEARLLEHPALREAVVVLREDAPGLKRLVAYIVPRGDAPAHEALRAHLKAALPEYMLPSAFVPLAALPLNANGKLDRRVLPLPTDGDEAASHVAARTGQEASLLRIWREVLGAPAIGVRDNFFDAGGHSLLATRLVSRLRRELGCELPVRALFEAPTVELLAERLAEASAAEARTVPALPRHAGRPQDFPLSFAQQRLWFLHQMEPHGAAYNIAATVRLLGRLDVSALRAALEALVQRHEALRTSFHDVGGEPVQRVAPVASLPWQVLDLSAHGEAARGELVRQGLAEQACEPFELAQGPLLRVLLVTCSKQEHWLQATMHHIVSDGWSMGVLVRELAALYGAAVQGRDAQLPPLPIQYADFAVWQRQWLEAGELQRQTAYWLRTLAGEHPVLELPSDRPRPSIASGRGGKHRFHVDAELAARWRALCREQGATLFTALLAAFDAWLHALTERTDLVVGTDIANRSRAETEGVVGFFVNQLALRADLSGNPTFTELLARTRQRMLDAQANQDLPFNKLVEALNPARRLSHAPLFQVKLVLQNQDEQPLELPQLQVLPQPADHGQVQLDLLLAVTETESGLGAVLEYSSDLFDADTAVAMCEQFVAVLRRCADEPQLRLDALARDVGDAARRFHLAKQAALQAQARAQLQTTRRVRRSAVAVDNPLQDLES